MCVHGVPIVLHFVLFLFPTWQMLTFFKGLTVDTQLSRGIQEESFNIFKTSLNKIKATGATAGH